MNFSENEFRDYLFAHHSEDLYSLIVGRRDATVWNEEGFPPIHFLLQQQAENKINSILDELKNLVLLSKELRLEKAGDSTTRVDLLGNSESSGLTIIELKKSKQTERQSFTELLAYANHFCSIFPGLTENSITTILIAPMESRIVRDAYVQELVINNKKVLSLIPTYDDGNITLTVYYPDKICYQWFENNLLDDKSMLTVAIAFPEIEGWIDTDIQSSEEDIPEYSKNALNTITSSIASKLETNGVHGLVYASQYWGEVGQHFPYPNRIFVVAINPFAPFRTSIQEGVVYGDSNEGRLEGIQVILSQICSNEKDFWIETMETSFHNEIIRTVREELEFCFKNVKGEQIQSEISLPDWHGIKTSMIESVFVHNLEVYLSGLLKEIYLEYVRYIYEAKEDHIYYYDDLPKYAYDTLRNFLPVWEILSGLGVGDDE